MPNKQLTALAASKVKGHCEKYAWANVFGLLLCGKDDAIVVDALPLFHTPLLAPTLEVALLLCAQHCSNTNTRICGAYYSGEEMGLPQVKRVLSQLQANLKIKSIALLVLKNGELRSAYERTAQDFVPTKFELESTQPRALVVDFEDTLENVLLDFRN